MAGTGLQPTSAPGLVPAAPTDLLLWDRLPVVLDTNVLLSDCEHVVARKGRPSFLLQSARLPVARLFATERVKAEVERHLPAHATRSGLDPKQAMQTWHEQFVPLMRFVEIEGEPSDPRVAALALRHPNDGPTGLLAELLAPCLVFSRDKDLLNTGIAEREWVELTSKAQSVAELQAITSGGLLGAALTGALIWEGGRVIVAAARSAPTPTVLIGVVTLSLARSYWNSDRGVRRRSEARSLLGDAGRGVGSVWSRADEARRLLEAAAFVPQTDRTDMAQAARVVAVAPTPPRPSEVASRAGISTQKATALLRASAFLRTDEGTYMLGRGYGVALEAGPSATSFLR
jgi:hypothetical protein